MNLFEDYLSNIRPALMGCYILNKTFNKPLLCDPYDSLCELAENEIEDLQMDLNNCMPLNNMMMDLWDWDIRFEYELGDEWYFNAAFGYSTSKEDCAEELANIFFDSVDRYGLDYDQSNDFELFFNSVKSEANSFISDWRKNIEYNFYSKCELNNKLLNR